jgi:hypothetical protein
VQRRNQNLISPCAHQETCTHSHLARIRSITAHTLTQHSTVTTLSTRKHTRTLARTLARAPSHTTLQLIDHNGIEALERTRTCLVLRCALTLKVASRRYVPQCCSSAAEIPHPPPGTPGHSCSCTSRLFAPRRPPLLQRYLLVLQCSGSSVSPNTSWPGHTPANEV